MREPSTLDDRWRWWESALAGEAPPVHEMEPQQGYYALRKFRYSDWPRGPYVPARIWWAPSEIDPDTGELLSDEQCLAEIDGERVNAWTSWTFMAKRPISEAEWRFLRALSPLLPSKIPPRA